jgi:hypothetical protein
MITELHLAPLKVDSFGLGATVLLLNFIETADEKKR